MVVTTYGSEQEAAQALTSLLLPAYQAELPRIRRIDRWWRWNPEPIRLKEPTAEHRMLRDMAATPWLRLIVTSLAQTLYLEGVSVPGDDETNTISKRMWQPWTRSRMSSQQIALHQAAIAYGIAYATVSTVDGRAQIDCHTPRTAIALYNDPAQDVYPQVFVRTRRIRDNVEGYELWDATYHWSFVREQNQLNLVSCQEHGAQADGDPVCPVVRYCNSLDLEGRAPGEVEPYMSIANRLNKDTYDRMLAQHYNSWKVRTATGLDLSHDSSQEREKTKLKLRHDDILVGDAGVEFGTLPETSLNNLTEARTADIEELAAVSQTPTTAFGRLVNVGDAGIEESRAGFYAKRDQRRKTFGVSHLDVLRLASSVEGRDDDASRFDLTALWADTDTRTMSQAVDALGKAAQMLDVPATMLWDMIPGVNKARADEWRAYRAEHPTSSDLATAVYAHQLVDNEAGGISGVNSRGTEADESA